MYYEARTHQLLPVANAMDAAIKIKGGLVANYQVPTWTEGLNPVYIVPDGHINNPMFELAPNFDKKYKGDGLDGRTNWLK